MLPATAAIDIGRAQTGEACAPCMRSGGAINARIVCRLLRFSLQTGLVVTRRAGGFSLAELVVVLGLVALLAGAVPLAVSRTVHAPRARAGGEWVASILRRAIRLCWTASAPVRVVFRPGSLDISVLVWNGREWRPAAGFFGPPGIGRPLGAAIVSTSYPGNVLTITPVGYRWEYGGLVEAAVRATEGWVTVGSGGATVRVQTTSSGMVSISR